MISSRLSLICVCCKDKTSLQLRSRVKGKSKRELFNKNLPLTGVVPGFALQGSAKPSIEQIEKNMRNMGCLVPILDERFNIFGSRILTSPELSPTFCAEKKVANLKHFRFTMLITNNSAGVAPEVNVRTTVAFNPK